jgi:hypothetical protein
MTHCLRERKTESPWTNPLVVSLRYRCTCATNEVLQIQTVLDMNMSEEAFIWTMKNLWRDVKFEVKQHIEEAA